MGKDSYLVREYFVRVKNQNAHLFDINIKAGAFSQAGYRTPDIDRGSAQNICVKLKERFPAEEGFALELLCVTGKKIETIDVP